MKQLLFAFCILISTVGTTNAQEEQQPPYLKHPMLPTFELLNLDSSKTFTTYDIPEGRPIVLMFFSPDCDHCEQMTEKIKANMDVFKKARIYMMTPLYLPLLRDFYERLELKEYKNIKVGKDFKFFFPRFYNVSTVPFLAVYDKKKKLVAGFPGKSTIEEIMEAVKKGQ